MSGWCHLDFFRSDFNDSWKKIWTETNIYKKYTYKIISSEDKIIFPVETFKWKKPKNNHYVPERNIKVSAQQSQNSNVCIMSFPQGLKWWI